MKWPKSLTMIRHGESAYNALKAKKAADIEYSRFLDLFDEDPTGEETHALAATIYERYALGCGDYETPLTDDGWNQARHTGKELPSAIPQPDIIIYSPYHRTRDTLAGLTESWHALEDVRRVEDDRIREREHGLSLLYDDWRVFQTFHPVQREFLDLVGPYWYQFPQGESISMVRDRVRSFIATLIREHHDKHVLLVTHHLTILSIRANLERMTPEAFMTLNEEERPKNCSVTHYVCDPEAGIDGRIKLDFYNKQLY